MRRSAAFLARVFALSLLLGAAVHVDAPRDLHSHGATHCCLSHNAVVHAPVAPSIGLPVERRVERRPAARMPAPSVRLSPFPLPRAPPSAAS